jgi:hypothetical protein
MSRKFTAAQTRALHFLTAEWARFGSVSAAVYSLALSHKDLVETKIAQFGPRRGWQTRARLTAAGLEAKARLAK